jgi:hypothetical protein
VPNGCKFNLQSLDNSVNEFNLEYWGGDEADLSAQIIAAGLNPRTNEQISFSSNWKQDDGGTADVNEWRFEAPLHPGIVLNARDEISTGGTSTATGRASLIFKKESYNQFSLGTLTTAEKTGLFIGAKINQVVFPIGSDDFSVAPETNEKIVGDTSGAVGDLVEVNSGDMTALWVSGTFVSGETVTTTSVAEPPVIKTSTIPLPSQPTKSYSDKPYKLCITPYRGQGANTTAARAIYSWSVQGQIVSENSQGGSHGASKAGLWLYDDIVTPTLGLRMVLNESDSTYDFQDHNGAVKFVFNPATKVITATGGITFELPAATGAKTPVASTLDDYEEGTYTPIITDASDNAGTAAYASGSYTKIGDVITVQGHLINITTTPMTAGDDVRISLPVTSISSPTAIGSVSLASTAASGNLTFQTSGTNAYANIAITVSGGAVDYVTVADLTSLNADVFFTISYKTN